jgi:Spy/CpxP family protein refolding chaperone
VRPIDATWQVCEHHFVLAADESGEVLDWQGSFSEYLEYRDAKAAVDEAAAAAKAAAAAAAAKAAASAEAPTPPESTGGGGGDGDGKKVSRPLSAFEVKEMARLEAQLDDLTVQQEELQRKCATFDERRNGYSELAEWTEQVEALKPKMEAVEEKWLALAERAEV